MCERAPLCRRFPVLACFSCLRCPKQRKSLKKRCVAARLLIWGLKGEIVLPPDLQLRQACLRNFDTMKCKCPFLYDLSLSEFIPH